jgi:hypothetical protein
VLDQAAAVIVVRVRDEDSTASKAGHLFRTWLTYAARTNKKTIAALRPMQI